MSISAALKGGSSVFVVAFLCAGGAAAGTLPTSGQYIAGRGTISKSGSKDLSIDQSSITGIIDWKSFSIGKHASVDFNNGSGATLNRVIGGNLSTIAGALHATGSVYLINSAGMIVSHTGKVITGGDFIGSSRDLTDGDIGNGKRRFTGNSHGDVTNQGTITSGGDAVLIGRNVTNDGKISAANGTAGLAAGNNVLLRSASADQRLSVKAGSGNVTNSGGIASAAAELRAANGNVYALAGNNGGIVRAIGTNSIGGHIWLTSAGGTTQVTGTLAASHADGAGGTIETSGDKVSLGGTINAGKGGSWLVDPKNLTVKSAAAHTIAASLNAGTNVTLKTTKTSASGPGHTSSGDGDVIFASSLQWSGAAVFRARAYHNLIFNKGVTIANTGAGSFKLYADNTGDGVGSISFGKSSTIDWSQSTGHVSLFYDPTGKKKYKNAVDYSPFLIAGENAHVTQYLLVNTIQDLQNMSQNFAANYALGRNIDASITKSWNSGSGFEPIDEFYGIFAGRGHTISHLFIDANDTNEVGLFGYMGGTVQNVKLTDARVVTKNAFQVGILAASNTGSVRDVTVQGFINDHSKYENVGGLLGYNDGELESSSADVELESGKNAIAGGAVGWNDGRVISVTSAGSVIGGVARDQSWVGGLLGFNQGFTLDSSSSANVSGTNLAGGLVGENFFHMIASSSASGDVTGKIAGGLVGLNFGGLISESSSSSDVIATSSGGGLVAKNLGGIEVSFSTGSVSGDKGAKIGGLVGVNNAANQQKGTVEGSINNAYSRASVTCSGSAACEVGGLVGENDGAISQGLAWGLVSGGNADDKIGGLVGWSNGGTIQDSYWDTETTAQDVSSGGGTGETTTQLEASLPSGFDPNVWGHKDGAMPYLIWAGPQ